MQRVSSLIPSTFACPISERPDRQIQVRLSNQRLKLAARVDCGMNLFSARRSLSAIR
jgi:hypothetical protein